MRGICHKAGTRRGIPPKVKKRLSDGGESESEESEVAELEDNNDDDSSSPPAPKKQRIDNDDEHSTERSNTPPQPDIESDPGACGFDGGDTDTVASFA